MHIIWEALNCLLSVMFECQVSLLSMACIFKPALAVKLLIAFQQQVTIHVRKNGLEKKKKFSSGRFILPRRSAGVVLHFQEAPRWSWRVHMYQLLWNQSSSNLQVTKTGMKCWTGSNSGRIWPVTLELHALELWKKWCLAFLSHLW